MHVYIHLHVHTYVYTYIYIYSLFGKDGIWQPFWACFQTGHYLKLALLHRRVWDLCNICDQDISVTLDFVKRSGSICCVSELLHTDGPWVSARIFWNSELIFWVSNRISLYFGCLQTYFWHMHALLYVGCLASYFRGPSRSEEE